MNKKLLILIDCQNDFITGTLANPRAEAKIANIVKKVKEHDGIVIATHDTHFTKLQVESAWPPAEGKAYEDTMEGQILKTVHCIKLTEGWEIQKDILAACHEKNGTNGPTKFHCIDKYTFGWDGWKEYLKAFDFDEIELCGFVAGICVDSNATILRALYPNMPITVDAACTAGFGPDDEKAAYTCMKMKEINVINED
jgi:nicotinamidase-related amidase